MLTLPLRGSSILGYTLPSIDPEALAMSEDKTPPEDLDSTRTAEPLDSGEPRRIGPYKILQKLGAGRMGEVTSLERIVCNWYVVANNAAGENSCSTIS